MAVKGTESKQNITKELLNYFGERAFLYNDGKEIRVNCYEAGELVQIKIALTAAKVAVEIGADVALPGANSVMEKPAAPAVSFATTPATQEVPQPTAEEKQNISDLLKSLGL